MKPPREKGTYGVGAATALLLTAMALCCGVLDWFTPMFGDDLARWSGLGGDTFTHPDRSTVSDIAAHFFGANGRVLDNLCPVMAIWLPKPVVSCLMGLMGGLYFCSVALAAGANRKRHTAFCISLVAVTLAVMPWWDSMWLRVCQFSYLWGTTFCLLTIVLFFSLPTSDKRHGIPFLSLLFSVGFLGASSHEQHAVALLAGLAARWIAVGGRDNLSRARKWLLGGVVSGALIPFLSPNFWSRSAAACRPYSAVEIMLSTLPLLALLLLAVIVISFTRKGRSYLAALLPTPWLVYVVMGIAPGAIALFSGIPGRTGWLAESCAVVAMARMLLALRVRISRPWAVAVSASGLLFIALHYGVSISAQVRADREHAEAVAALKASDDGIVYGDFTRRAEFNPLCLYRVKGVPDNDDRYLIQVLSSVYKADSVYVCIINPRVGRSMRILDHCPEGVRERRTFENLPLLTLDDGALTKVVTPFRSSGRVFWLVEPMQPDPGDRLPD